MLELIVKRTKRSVSVVSKQPGATKNESICFSLFTLYFWLLSQRQFKKTAIHKLQKPRPQLLFHRPRFFSFLKTHTPSTLAASADKIQGREKRRDRGDKTKDKNSNICSRFQPDSLMGITQHFVPWPWLTKTHIGGGGGDACETAWDALGGECPESAPARVGPAGALGAACHSDCHSFSTKMAAWQMNVSGEGIKCHFPRGATEGSPVPHECRSGSGKLL